MVVFKNISIPVILKFNGRNIIILAGIACLTWLTSVFIKVQEPTTLLPSTTVFGTIMSLFLAFKTNEAYNRWWEARKLWGQLVNSSRIFARQVLNLITLGHHQNIYNENELKEVQKELIYRHLAFINALRLSLRKESDWEELAPFIDEKERLEISNLTNLPTQLILKQAEQLKNIFNQGTDNDYRYMQIDETLNKFYDIQGACERIKNTVFPRIYSLYTTSFTWLFVFSLIFSLFDEFDWQVLTIRTLVGYVFVSLEKISRFLKDPFENRISDTPMSALCRTIEIDLREMLKENEVPAPVKPVNGVLY